MRRASRAAVFCFLSVKRRAIFYVRFCCKRFFLFFFLSALFFVYETISSIISSVVGVRQSREHNTTVAYHNNTRNTQPPRLVVVRTTFFFLSLELFFNSNKFLTKIEFRLSVTFFDIFFFSPKRVFNKRASPRPSIPIIVRCVCARGGGV